MEQVVQAVKSGKVDCFVCESGKAEAYLKNTQFYNIYLTQPGNTSFALNRSDTVLMSIANKTLKSIPTSMLTGAVSMYDNAEKKVTIQDFIKDNWVTVFVVSFIFFAAVLVVILSLLKKSKKSEEKANQSVEQMKELNKQLQESHKELEEAVLRAESANSAKTTFLNNMSHDIRTPMNAIIGFTDIALKQPQTPETKEYLKKIKKSSDYLLSLINDVLDISRIESGKIKYNVACCNITEILDTVVNIAKGFLTNRNIDFLVTREKMEYPYVWADAIRIREVLVNILSNAIKYTKDGGRIHFDTNYKKEDDQHVKITFTIRDTGIGMSEDFQKHIFDEFSQEKSDARTQYKGTGLGMTITKKYVDMMGGTIHIQSRKDVGTTVTVQLSLEIAEKKDSCTQTHEEVIKDLKNVKILLVEDNDLNAEIAKVQLEDYGILVSRACDGQEAVNMFKNNAPNTYDLILMDIMMPVMNGYDATKTIRNVENRPDGKRIPIIAMTANAFAEDIQAAIDAGMNAHLSKPIDMNEVVKVISKNL